MSAKAKQTDRFENWSQKEHVAFADHTQRVRVDFASALEDVLAAWSVGTIKKDAALDSRRKRKANRP